jgi:hypothetical protein
VAAAAAAAVEWSLVNTAINRNRIPGWQMAAPNRTGRPFSLSPPLSTHRHPDKRCNWTEPRMGGGLTAQSMDGGGCGGYGRRRRNGRQDTKAGGKRRSPD